MRSILFLVVIIALGAFILFISKSEEESITETNTLTMELTSPVFDNGGMIPSVYTCDGENINPPLVIEEVPENTESFVLIVEDPDVPREVREDQMFDHWVLYNISGEVREIPEAADETIGSRGKNTRGDSHYTGPCPPTQYEPAEHRYFFRMYAVDTTFHFNEPPTKDEVLEAIDGHVIEEAQLIGRYERLQSQNVKTKSQK